MEGGSSWRCSGMPSSMADISSTMSSSLLVAVRTRFQLTDCSDWREARAELLRSSSMPICCCDVSRMPAMRWFGMLRGGLVGRL